MNRSEFGFGRGSFVGTIMRDPEAFFGSDIRDQARILGWVAGCPVVEELTDPANQAPGRGPEEMTERYGQVSFWFSYALDIIGRQNPELYEQMITDIPRREDEPVGKHEPQSIPVNYLGSMQPMTTLTGYVLPRLFIEEAGIRQSLPREERAIRLQKATQAVSSASLEATTPHEFLARFADSVLRAGDVDTGTITKHLLAKGWLEEHGAHSMYADFIQVIKERTPQLHAAIFS